MKVAVLLVAIAALISGCESSKADGSLASIVSHDQTHGSALSPVQARGRHFEQKLILDQRGSGAERVGTIVGTRFVGLTLTCSNAQSSDVSVKTKGYEFSTTLACKPGMKMSNSAVFSLPSKEQCVILVGARDSVLWHLKVFENTEQS